MKTEIERVGGLGFEGRVERSRSVGGGIIEKMDIGFEIAEKAKSALRSVVWFILALNFIHINFYKENNTTWGGSFSNSNRLEGLWTQNPRLFASSASLIFIFFFIITFARI